MADMARPNRATELGIGSDSDVFAHSGEVAVESLYRVDHQLGFLQRFVGSATAFDVCPGQLIPAGYVASTALHAGAVHLDVGTDALDDTETGTVAVGQTTPVLARRLPGYEIEHKVATAAKFLFRQPTQ